MKKVKIIFLAFAFSIGCSKEENQPDTSSSNPGFEAVKIEKYQPKVTGSQKTNIPPMLYFPTVEEYDNILLYLSQINESYYGLWSGLQGFTSLYSSYNTTIINDPLISTILNTSGMLRIGDWIFRINNPDQSVYALHINNIDSYVDFYNLNTSNPNVLRYGFDEDVLAAVGLDEALGIFCKETNRSTQSTLDHFTPEFLGQLSNGGWNSYRL